MLNIVNYRGYIWDSVLGCQCLFIPTTACKYLLCTRHTVYSSKKKKKKKKDQDPCIHESYYIQKGDI